MVIRPNKIYYVIIYFNYNNCTRILEEFISQADTTNDFRDYKILYYSNINFFLTSYLLIKSFLCCLSACYLGSIHHLIITHIVKYYVKVSYVFATRSHLRSAVLVLFIKSIKSIFE